MKSTKNVDHHKYDYSGNGTGFAVHSDFSINGELVKAIIFWCGQTFISAY